VRRTWLLGHATFHVLAGAAAVLLGATYPGRMSPARGFHLVEGDDAGPRPPLDRPERVVVSVIDGLGVQEARPTRAVGWFAAHGRCFETAVGSPSVSRPLYTVLSSGVEQDRTGVRSNDSWAAAPVRSIWEDARAAGWPVRAVSPILWWTQLFPRGFDQHVVPADGADAFALVRPGAMTLVHVLYVDDAGHAAGAASGAYADAVARADREVMGLVGRTDLATSLLVLTADHGHALRGGHGGLQPRVATVMTCFAGKNVRADPAIGALRATAVAPAVALLAGLPFPRHMRAGAGAVEDDLDVVLSLVQPEGNAAFLVDRREAVERSRSRAQAALSGSWSDLYARERARQRTVALAVVVMLGLALFARGDRPRTFWGVATIGGMAIALAAGRGSFDLTAINQREQYVAQAGLAFLLVGAASAFAFARLRRSLDGALRLQTPIALALLGLTLGHSVVYGFRLGFPLPRPSLLFLPLFSTLALGVTAVLGLGLCVVLAARALRARP
jgi:hypothetical protein